METHGESWNIILVSSSKAHGLTIVDGFGASLAHQALSENDLQIVVFFPWIHKIYVNGLEWKINAICWFNIAMGNPPFLVYSLFLAYWKVKYVFHPQSMLIYWSLPEKKTSINHNKPCVPSIFPWKKSEPSSEVAGMSPGSPGAAEISRPADWIAVMISPALPAWMGDLAIQRRQNGRVTLW